MLIAFLLALVVAAHSASPNCPNGTIYDASSDLCYLFGKIKLNFSSAENECIRNGGHLTSIANAFQNSFLASAAKDAKLAENVWIGFTSDLSSGAKWQWIDGSAVSYTHWKGNNEPKPDGPDRCADFQHSNGDWHDHHCREELEFICTVAKTDGRTTPAVNTTSSTTTTRTTSTSTKITTTPTSTTVTDAWSTEPTTAGCNTTGICESGWTICNGYCFLVLRTTVTNDEASSVCEANNATLASIHSEEENDLVTELALTAVYDGCVISFGLILVNGTTQYGWTDGSPFDYTNWHPGYPTGYNCSIMPINPPGAHCAGETDGTWFDEFCGGSGDGVACKKPAIFI